MVWKLTATGFLLSIAAIMPLTEQWWERKPYMEWTTGEVEKVMNDSPWVAFSLATYPAYEHGPRLRPGRSPLTLRFMLLSSTPIRIAYLRRVSFPAGPMTERLVRTDDLTLKSEAEESEAKLRRFIAEYPDDIRIQGDHLHIVIAMCMVQSVPLDIQSGFHWRELPLPDTLRNLKLADLSGRTYLSTSAGRRVGISGYNPPRTELSDATFYFPRLMSDGTPLIDGDEKELRFETSFQGKTIKVKYDLRKTLFQGRMDL
jgi:hypothetical protein